MSKIEVNTIDVQCGSTLTVGSSGKTVSLATGASQTGFGRTGTVDWCTTAKTGPFTAVSGDGFFVNTTSGAITITLPSSPSQGDIVAFKDYANTWDNNNVTLSRNGSKINGQCEDATLRTESQSVTLIYVDGTKGWQDIHDSTANVTGGSFVAATGGTVITCGNFKTHVFTSTSTFVVSDAGSAGGSNTIEYLVVAGGGSSGCADQNAAYAAGGGGGGGFRIFECGSPNPLNAPAALPVSVQTYPVTVGAGGSFPSTTGSPSVFSTITSTGGGQGGWDNAVPGGTGRDGGSGGGGGAQGGSSGGSGNTPPVSPAQGTAGGDGTSSGHTFGGGGGGASAVGANGSSPGSSGGAGGAGSFAQSGFFGPSAASFGAAGPAGRYFSGGGGGGVGYPGGSTGTGGAGGLGGGGTGTNAAASNAGTANTGGGGGGGRTGNAGGGSGIIAIRYKFQ